jgi:hypothetical protein
MFSLDSPPPILCEQLFQNKTETFNLGICSPTALDSVDGDLYESHDLSYLRPFNLSDYDPKFVAFIPLVYGSNLL